MDNVSVLLSYDRDDTAEQRKEKVMKAIRTHPVYWAARRSVKEMCMTRSISDVQILFPQLLSASPVAPRLRSLIHVLDRLAIDALNGRTAGDGDKHEPLEYVEAVRLQWDTRLRYQLRAVAAHQKRPLIMARRRPGTDEPHMQDGLPSHLVYSWVDLLNDLENLTNPNATATFSTIKGFGMIKICLQTPSLSFLRTRYQQLSPDVRQVGLDDELAGLEWFREQRCAEGERLLNDSQASIADLMRYARTGVHASLRPRIWKRILGVWFSERDGAYYERLIVQVRKWDMITDDLYRLEVQETTDNAAYFVFEDMLDEMMLAFSRDRWLPVNCVLPLCVAPLAVNLNEASGETPLDTSGLDIDEEGVTIVPPCQVIPFHLQVMLAAPLCYLFQRPEQTYFVFRKMYARYFCRLQLISSRDNTILFLSKLFEDLVQAHSPNVFYHAVEVGQPPLRVVFPWIFTAFSGYLAVDQVLTLWDRILAYDSLELLAILAAAIFLFRSQSVLNATNADEIRDIFEDGAYFRVLPLLQHFLFDSSR